MAIANVQQKQQVKEIKMPYFRIIKFARLYCYGGYFNEKFSTLYKQIQF